VFLEPLFTSTAVVAIGEIGDKTQLLAIVLAAKFRRPAPIILGILAATILNHLAAATLGFYVSAWLSGQVFRIVVGLGFIAMAGWALIPDRMDDELKTVGRGGVFLTAMVTFFIVEIGDKTQIATVALAAKYQSVALVAAGTTLGMMLANLPVLWLGNKAAGKLPLKWIRLAAAALFLSLGVAALLFG